MRSLGNTRCCRHNSIDSSELCAQCQLWTTVDEIVRTQDEMKDFVEDIVQMQNELKNSIDELDRKIDELDEKIDEY